MPYTIGLTGGIGSGKSTVAGLFEDLGAGVIDTDKIAHDLTAVGGTAMPALSAEFGAEYVAADGSLNRAVMRKRAFSDAEAKRRLEAILHPLIRQAVNQQIESSSTPYVLLAVPLLLETSAYCDRLARVLVIDCDSETQVMRTMARSGLSDTDVRGIMQAQVSREERCRAANDIILNSEQLQALSSAVKVLDQRYRVLAAMDQSQR